MIAQKTLHPHLVLAGIVLFHSFSAIAVTLANKATLNHVQAPVSLLAFQTGIQVFLLVLSGSLCKQVVIFKPWKNWLAVIPLSVARLIGILAKTLCLQAVDAAFYQIARGMLLPFTVALSFLLLSPRPRLSQAGALSIVLVIIGFAWGFATDMQSTRTSTKGLFIGIGSSLTTAIESVVVKHSLSRGEKGEGIVQLAYMSSFLQFVFFSALVCVTQETNLIIGNQAMMKQFLQGAMLSGIANTLLVIATFLQILITSPITHTVVSAARGVVQSFVAAMLFGEVLSAGRLVSMAQITIGTVMYGIAKEQEKQAEYIPISNEDYLEAGEIKKEES